MKLLSNLICWLSLSLSLPLTALASPGAHGPNGEHLDAPASAAAGAGNIPRVETYTESFELVGQLSGGELSILIDRYETNEPVLNGKLEVQYKNLKAPATFHGDIGDFAVADVKLLAALSKPGKHQLLFTFTAGDESDLIEGTLEVPPTAAHAHDDGPHWPRRALILGAMLAATAAIAATALLLARRRAARTSLN